MPLTRSSFKAMKRYITLLVKTKDSGNKKEALKLINTLIAEKGVITNYFL